MRQLPADKYNVAWFKLAEFIVRGERERALGLYRLLAHSFNDQALGLKLEGDILLSFKDDKSAAEKYLLAANLYANEGRFQESIALYQTIFTLNGIDIDHTFVISFLELYERTENYSALQELLDQIANNDLLKGGYRFLLDFLKKYDYNQKVSLEKIYQKIFFVLICNSNDEDFDLKDELFEKILLLLLEDNNLKVQTFMSSLQELNDHYYQRACIYLRE